MLRTLIRAGVADLRAGLVDSRGELAATRHVAGGQAADLSTIQIEGNAPAHHFHIVLTQTCARARIASKCTCIAGINGGLVLLDKHGELLLHR
ncbi:hypothetical protein [Massilia scottii]|uniref:hypothetical protein n=1 Tax=Massilia scottii TaxID=3057166 RepID=UPI0035B5B116